MQLRLARVPSAIAAAVIVLLGVSRPAEAGFSMTLSDGIAADTQVISLTSGGVNTFSATVGHFAVGGVANLTEDPNIADTMTQLTFNIHSNAAAAETLTITLTASDLQLVPHVESLVSDVGASLLTNGSSFSYQSFYDATNSGLITGPTTGLQGPFSNPSNLPNYNDPANILVKDLTPYQPTTLDGKFSMTSVLTFNAGQYGSLATTGTTTVTATPEPATLGMAVIAAVGGITCGLRRVRRSGKDSANRIAA